MLQNDHTKSSYVLGIPSGIVLPWLVPSGTLARYFPFCDSSRQPKRNETRVSDAQATLFVEYWY
jgi:hypothetical protein